MLSACRATTVAALLLGPAAAFLPAAPGRRSTTRRHGGYDAGDAPVSTATSLPDGEGKLNKFSRRLTELPENGAAQAMLYATGLVEEDMKKAQVGIASVWLEGNPCNMHLLDLGQDIKTSVEDSGMVGCVVYLFPTPTAPPTHPSHRPSGTASTPSGSPTASPWGRTGCRFRSRAAI
jgi:hypothetical protein